MSMDVCEGPSFPRVLGNYEACFQPFLLHNKNYVVQYNHLYLQRLSLMRTHMIQRVQAKWGPEIKILEKIIDLQGDVNGNTSEDVVLIGMIAKDHKLRGSILDGVKENGVPSSLRPLTALVSDRDSIIMEDFSGRVTLDGAIKAVIHHIVTGIVMAVKGKLNEDGIFMASEWLYSYELKSTPAVNPAPVLDSTENAKYVLFVSGLLIGSTELNDVHDINVQQLVEFVCGRYGDEKMSTAASRIARVVIAGNCVTPTDPVQLKEKFSSQKYKASLSTPSKQFDIWVSQLLSSCYVDVMPGATDPANIAVPQQPFHPCLFPHGSRYGSLERVTNPYQCKLDSISILGHSGQPVRDIARLTHGEMFSWPTPHHDVHQRPVTGIASTAEGLAAEAPAASEEDGADEVEVDIAETPMIVDGAEDEETAVEVDPKPKRLKVDFQSSTRRLDILKKTLEWGNLCPTAPDTMPSYPFVDRDPYMLTEDNMPQVLFAGNQPGYASELVEVHDGIHANRLVRVISLPEFRSTGTVVLCNIADPTFSCIPITFK